MVAERSEAVAGSSISLSTKLVGVPRIELGLHAPEACVMPLYHTPYMYDLKATSDRSCVHALIPRNSFIPKWEYYNIFRPIW